MSCTTGDATLQNESVLTTSDSGFNPENFLPHLDSNHFCDPFKDDFQQNFGGMIVRCHVRV